MNDLKICVLHSPKQYIIKCPPQGLMSIAAYLKSKDIKISVLDANIHYADVDSIKLESFNDFKANKRHIKEFNAYPQEFPEKELEEYFIKNKFDIIISDCHYTGTVNPAMQTFKLIKEVLPECIIIVGGIHSTMYSEKLLNTKLVDIVIKGEGEEVVYNIIRNLEDGESLENIEGIDYIDGSQIKNNPGKGFIKDLNNLAPVFEVYDDFEVELYREYIKAILGPFWYDQDPAGVLILSRGCIGRCTFCNARIVDQGKYRTFNEENTLMQLESLYELYKPKNFKIYDAMFGANKKQFRTVCNFMKEVEVPWGFETRVDLIKTKDIDLLKESYCKYMLFGIESVNLDTLKFNQKISPKKTEKYFEDAVRTIKETMDAGIICAISLLFGLPNEKTSVYEDTIKFFKENDLVSDKLELFPYVPIMYPGTLLWDLTPPNQRCYDWEKFFIMTENVIKENKIIYVNPDFTNEELNYYVENCSRELFKNSNLTDKDFFKRDLRTIIDEGYDAIESEMDKEWFELSIKHTVEQYLSSLNIDSEGDD